METRALNVCRSRPCPEYTEDSEEDETPIRTREAEYEPGDRLFMTKILPDSTREDLCTVSTTSQKLAEGARRSAEAQEAPFILPNCVRGFESILPKKTSTSSQSTGNGTMPSNSFQVRSLSRRRSTLCLWWNKRNWTPS